jgi:hypothetical protein
MNIWIITTGSSDVQLKTEKDWNSLHSKVRSQLETQKQFSSSKSPDGKRFLYPARVMGIVYGDAIKNNLNHYEDLDFPLLNNFFSILEGKDGVTDKIIINRVIVLVTNQSEKFKASEKNNPFSAFWQDTYTLQPILEEYFKQRSIDNPEFLMLDPDPKKSSGLDNWNDVLERVQEKFKEKFADFKAIPEDTTIYVSHQAGTPAISSAVQFASLAKFGDRVRFLVSNEYQSEQTDFVESSSYLRGIRIQEAKVLLANYDYSGLMTLLKPYLNPRKPKEKRVRSLLKAAIQWNFAKFAKFKRLLILLNIAEEKNFPWYWIGYESAYLAVVRHQQGNIIEALFHSFRAAEGLICNWAEEKYKQYIYYDDKGAPQITERIQGILPEYWSKMADKNQRWITDLQQRNEKRQAKGQEPIPTSVGLFSQNLYALFETVRPESKKDPYMKVVLFSAKDERNQQFHRLLGLMQKDLFKAWKAEDANSWKDMVRCSLNFIAKDDLPKGFEILEDASFMAQVHRELKREIDHL